MKGRWLSKTFISVALILFSVLQTSFMQTNAPTLSANSKALEAVTMNLSQAKDASLKKNAITDKDAATQMIKPTK